MEAELVKQTLDVFHSKFYVVIFDFIVVAVVILTLKNVAEHIAGFIMIRLDKYISIGSKVKVYDVVGEITCVGLFNVTVETEEGFIRVPTKSWRTSKYMLLKD